MRILLANEAREGSGGVETYLAATADALNARGHDVALLYANTAAERGPTVIRTTESWSVADEGLGSLLPRIRAWHPDVLFSHNMHPLSVDEALASTGPLVKMMHGYLGTCVSGQKAFLFPSARPCTRRCGPACLALYAPRRCGKLRPTDAIGNYAWAARQRRLFDRYASIVVASEHMRDEFAAHGVAADRLHTIPLFTAVSRSIAPAAGDPIDVLFLGRMTPLKGSHLLVPAVRSAASRLGRAISVVLAGDGPERPRLQQTFSTASDVVASIPGWVGSDERASLLSRARVLVVPSVWPEPFGLVGLEAASAGVPVVAFNVGGIPEWLSDGEGGRLVSIDAGAEGLGAAIAEIVASPELRARYSAGARRTASRFTPEAHLSRLEAVLEAARRS